MTEVKHAKQGFTLAELLIALAILGVIATFTIPKVLQTQQDMRNMAMAKETMAMISEAYQIHKLNRGITASTGFGDLTPYVNYVRIRQSGTIDNQQSGGGDTTNCDNVYPCVHLANGAVLMYYLGETFAGTNTTNAVRFLFDPDGMDTAGGMTGPNRSVSLWLYNNGKVVDRENMLPNTYTSIGGPNNPSASGTPPWFTWN